jgi:uncharacterized membrane protein
MKSGSGIYTMLFRLHISTYPSQKYKYIYESMLRSLSVPHGSSAILTMCKSLTTSLCAYPYILMQILLVVVFAVGRKKKSSH